ncbi:MAG TPA: TonB-dependent receptor [Ideonella sp.]|nr:TonB-dependent receptor [Ideonella sp.]HJV71510.1 TonB-dependent receptor [Ideonella sp.]
MMNPPFARRRWPALMALVLPALAQAQSQPEPAAQSVVVTGTRLEEQPFDVPASVDRIGPDQIREHRLQANIAEALGGVPGLLARDRQNYAQDVQISVRGFGARASFGIRGVRMYVDGIPATLPDGQGQVSHVDLSSAERIEILRGPFSALYGNSSGGVIEVTTEGGSGAPTASLGLAGGGDGTLRANLQASGSSGDFGYAADLAHFETDGWREHSAVRRELGNLKLTWRPTADALAGDKLTVVANSIGVPEAQDPLGLKREQFEADPRSVDPVALAFNTRKAFDQTQLGANYEHVLARNQRLQLMAYGGSRHTEQFQAIPTAPQGSPNHPGGVIDLARDYQGADLRWTLDERNGAMPYALVAGIAFDGLDEHRRGYENFIGETLGVKGALRRDESNRSNAFDQYLQATLRPAPQWRLDAGVRHSKVTVKSRDHYISGPNGDDSGDTDFSATTPVASVMYLASDDLHLYASAGRGFETPTLNELAYRPDGSAGLNTTLKPARSDNLELGAKWRIDAQQALNVAVFAVRTNDEIVTQTNLGGRASFQNAGKTRRDGVEVGWQARLAGDWKAQAALTWLDAKYDESFTTCAAPPCSEPTLVIPAGNRLPGVARNSGYAALRWAPEEGWQAGAELRALSRVMVNDTNSDYAAGFATVAASVGYKLRRGPWAVSGFLRADNVFDRRYAGSVIVNEGNGRFFEPAPGRTWLAGFNGSYSF